MFYFISMHFLMLLVLVNNYNPVSPPCVIQTWVSFLCETKKIFLDDDKKNILTVFSSNDGKKNKGLEQ